MGKKIKSIYTFFSLRPLQEQILFFTPSLQDGVGDWAKPFHGKSLTGKASFGSNKDLISSYLAAQLTGIYSFVYASQKYI